MKKFLLTTFYVLGLLGFGACVYKVYPLVWPTEPFWYVLIVVAMITLGLQTLTDILKLYIKE